MKSGDVATWVLMPCDVVLNAHHVFPSDQIDGSGKSTVSACLIFQFFLFSWSGRELESFAEIVVDWFH